jgi:acyl-CoA hydrolase
VSDPSARTVEESRSSAEVWDRIRAEALRTGGEPRPIAEAFVTMVALDAHGRPTPVPGLSLTNDPERKRFAEGRARTEARQRARTPRAG